MAFFKTKEEKRIEEEMEREEQMQAFNDQINELKKKREEYAKIAAEAEINEEPEIYKTAANNILELNDIISSLIQTKANFDLINASNSISISIATAVNALDKMANNSKNMPNLKKIQKVNTKVTKYMRQIKISNISMSRMMNKSNPANKARSDSEIASIKPLIDAQRAKLNKQSLPKTNVNSSAMDLSAEIEAEKNKLI